MTVSGTVENGVVVFAPGQSLPDGTPVVVTVSGPHAWLLKYAGTVPDLPPDLATQHDHYVHGSPKRTPPTPADFERDEEGIAILEEIAARRRAAEGAAE